MDWMPTLSDRVGPLYLQIVQALSDDIKHGRLRRGQQLPSHRSLARSLGIDLTTATRAYKEARGQGLIASRAGQGTFVAESQLEVVPDDNSALFDLSMNLPPQPAAADIEGYILRSLSVLSREGRMSSFLNYRDSGGSKDDRRIATEWIGGRIPHTSPECLALFPGAQNALMSILMTLTQPGDTILTERLTFPGLMAAARLVGVKLEAITSDKDGPVPKELDKAIEEHRPKALYLVPTINNPTTVTITKKRRGALAKVLSRHKLPLLEDDAYGWLEPTAEPIATILPELTYHIATLSKCIAPGFRFAFVIAPNAETINQSCYALRATAQMVSGLTLALVNHLINTRNIDSIIDHIRDEARARQDLAAKHLKGLSYDAHEAGHHIWLHLPHEWSAGSFAIHTQRLGLGVTPSDAFTVGGIAPNSVRVALGAARSRHDLVDALGVLGASLRSSNLSSRIV